MRRKLSLKGAEMMRSILCKAIRYRRLNEEYEAFSKAAGLQPRYERGNIAEFGPKGAQKAQKATKILQTSRKMI